MFKLSVLKLFSYWNAKTQKERTRVGESSHVSAYPGFTGKGDGGGDTFNGVAKLVSIVKLKTGMIVFSIFFVRWAKLTGLPNLCLYRTRHPVSSDGDSKTFSLSGVAKMVILK